MPPQFPSRRYTPEKFACRGTIYRRPPNGDPSEREASTHVSTIPQPNSDTPLDCGRLALRGPLVQGSGPFGRPRRGSLIRAVYRSQNEPHYANGPRVDRVRHRGMGLVGKAIAFGSAGADGIAPRHE